MASVFFYISGHGFGHAVRQIAIINALAPRLPAGTRIAVRTSAPQWLFDRTAAGSPSVLRAETDTGVQQVDSLRLDPEATIAAAAAFYSALPRHVEQEAALLARHDARLVVADAPPLACAAARAAGIPAFVASNFTWDWIYEEYRHAGARADEVIDTIRGLYANASGGWRLPMGGGFATVPAVQDLPLVARHARADLDVAEVRVRLGLPPTARTVLVSFGGYGVRDLPLDRLDCTPSWHVVLTAPRRSAAPDAPGVHVVDEGNMYTQGLRYEDLVRAVDVVLTKPGYGIISDCVANGAAMLYTSRGRFREYDVMVEEMPRVLRCRHIAMERFLAGAWRDDLDALSSAPAAPVRPRTDGADVAARLILGRLLPT